MRRKIEYLIAVMVGVLAIVLSTRSANGQVAVGPGFVDTCCVHVDWGCGHVHVVAPFVNLCINAPCCCECAPAPRCSSVSDASQPLSLQLANSAERLQHALDRFETGAGWTNYLAVGDGKGLSSKKQLKTVLDHFDSAAKDRQFQVITSLPEFAQTHRLLAAYVGESQSVAESPASSEPAISFTGEKSAKPTARMNIALVARDIARTSVEVLPEPPQVPYANAAVMGRSE